MTEIKTRAYDDRARPIRDDMDGAPIRGCSGRGERGLAILLPRRLRLGGLPRCGEARAADPRRDVGAGHRPRGRVPDDPQRHARDEDAQQAHQAPRARNHRHKVDLTAQRAKEPARAYFPRAIGPWHETGLDSRKALAIRRGSR